MRLKQAVAIFGSLILIAVLFVVYSARDLAEFPNRKTSIIQDFKDNKWLHFEDKIKQLEHDLNKHHNAVYEIKLVMKNMLESSSSFNVLKNNVVLYDESQNSQIIPEMMYESTCPFQINIVPKSDVQMLELYSRLTFDNIDGGVWKQGWRIEVDEKEWNRHNKLKVFVVPHSHNDPGWIKTFDEYYVTQTKHILDNMLNKLSEDPRRKFIWAEISFFSVWWDEQDDESREKVKRLLRMNQLEIVTGGWVMNDEANSHWISILNQLTDGHQWLQKNLNYTPLSHWAIDPFGMSLSQPYLLKGMGLKNMLIQRVHYLVKKYLASKQQLEFRWKQLWDDGGDTGMFTQLMPFYSYDIPHTCGPDPKICCQFDFKRLPNHGLHCPWKVAPQVISEKNIAERAELLLDQYRKKSKLFKTNVLLVPLGDDFRYDHPTEWDVQYNNYQKLFDYMNSNLKLNVQAQFGTLTDYFNELHKSNRSSSFPTLTGDFFTYADRDDHYWSGYYTSRPFYKRMDRILLSYIKAAETIYTLAHLSKNPGSSWIIDNKTGLEGIITSARESFSLFQHHDGITGTAKSHVVVDYGKKLLSAIQRCQRVIQLCTHILLKGYGAEEPNRNANYYTIDDIRHTQDVISEHSQITIGVPEIRTKKIVIYNSLTFPRHEVVTFYISTPFIEVVNFEGKRVKCQISPIFEYGSSMSQSKYQLSFIATVPALSLISFTINALLETELPSETVMSKVKILNHYGEVQPPVGFDPEISPSPSEFTLQNLRVTACFSKLGLLKAIKLGKRTIPVHLEFVSYGVRKSYNTERSGAYLFLPDGDATKIPLDNTIVNIIEGPIMSSVLVQLPHVQHSTIIYNTSGADGLGIDIQNVVDISHTNNFELAMKLSTNIKSSDEFFTDVNGYQIMRRKRFKKLPIQANYYPMPTLAYIEDELLRLSVITGSPLGCSSLAPGQIEIMLDRRLNQDDNLGLGQGVLDNHPTKHVFRILLEKRNDKCQATARNHPAGFPTLSAFVASQSLLNPMIRLLRTEDEDEVSRTAYIMTEQGFGVDYTMPVLKTNVLVKGNTYTGVVIHRQFLDTCFASDTLLQQFRLSDGTDYLPGFSVKTPQNPPNKISKSDGDEVALNRIIPIDRGKQLHRTSLSFLYLKDQVNLEEKLKMCPMEMQAFVF